MATKHFMTGGSSTSASLYADGYDDQASRVGSFFNPPHNYEVFLSFSGDDTRYSFTDHLYNALSNRNIKVFRDSENLHVGQEIDQLLEAIGTSKISVPIISTHYASSKWCLKELVQILKYNQQSALLVLPIFYRVKPSDVREQKGQFGEEFQRFKEKYSDDTELIQESKQAFKEIVSLKGWESDKFANGYEEPLVRAVVKRIFKELRKPILDVPDFLVGVEEHVKEIMKKIDAKQSNDVKIIAIHGMGGIGKTTLAKVLYNELFDYFESRSFVPNIREASSTDKGVVNLQKQVISDIFADKSLQEISRVDEGKTIIKNCIKGKRLLLLLDDVSDEDQLRKLAIKNNLFGSESIVIITTRNKDVSMASVVNLSYELNELDKDQSYKLFCKHAFGKDASCPSNLENITRGVVSTTGGLPIAIEVIGCLLYQKSEDFWSAKLEKLQRIPYGKGLDRLMLSYEDLDEQQKQIFLDIACLSIRFSWEYNHALYMWNACGFYPKEGIEVLVSLSLIKVRNKCIVIHDQLRDLGRAIVWREGHSNIGLRSRLWLEEEGIKVIEGKKGTPNIQALKLHTYRPSKDEIHFTSQQFEGIENLRFLDMEGNVRLTGDFENLFSNIIWLRWRSTCESITDFMGINFNPKKLVILELCNCNITEHWKGWNQVKNLKVLRIWDCNHLTTTPDFSAIEGLEELFLSNCSSLKKIHPSIGKFRKTLKVLHVQFCYEPGELPIQVWEMEELMELVIYGTGIRTKGGCKGVEYIPDTPGSLLKLLVLDLSYTPIKCLPASMLSKLQYLNLGGCKELESLPNLPSSLISLCFNGDSMETLPDFANLTNLKYLYYKDVFERRNRALNLRNLNQLQILQIGRSGTEEYEISDIELDEAPEDINLLLKLPLGLKQLTVWGCQTLRTFPDLSAMKNLSQLTLSYCPEINCLGLEGAESLSCLSIQGCRRLSKLSGVGTMVTNLRLESLNALQSLSNLSALKKLKKLEISKCNNLMEIQGLEDVESLETLKIRTCCSLERIVNLSHLKMLTTLELRDCEKLNNVQGIEKLTSLTRLCISKPLLGSQDLSQLTNLQWTNLIQTLPSVDTTSGPPEEKEKSQSGLTHQRAKKGVKIIQTHLCGMRECFRIKK